MNAENKLNLQNTVSDKYKENQQEKKIKFKSSNQEDDKITQKQNDSKSKENLDLLVSYLEYYAPIDKNETKLDDEKIIEPFVTGNLLLTDYNELKIKEELNTNKEYENTFPKIEEQLSSNKEYENTFPKIEEQLSSNKEYDNTFPKIEKSLLSNKVHEKPKIKNKESNFNTISAKRLYIPEFKEPKKSFKQFPPIQEYHPPEKKESKNAKVFSDINRRFEYLVRQSKASSSTIKEEDKLIINHLEVLKLFKEMEDLNIQYNKELKKNINLQNQTNSKEVIPKTQNPLTTEREIKKLKFEIKIANAKIQRLNNENQSIKKGDRNQIYNNDSRELTKIKIQNTSLKNDIKFLENSIKSLDKRMNLITKRTENNLPSNQ